MELGNELGKRIAAERKVVIETVSVDSARAEAIATEEARKEALREKLLRPYRLVEKLIESRAGDTEPVLIDKYISETFRLKPATLELDGETRHASLSLVVDCMQYSDDSMSRRRRKFTPFKLSLEVSAPGEPTSTHDLTQLSDPIMDHADGLPDNYGMRTYRNGERDKYEVNSYVPKSEEAQLIISAIEEAAELQGIFLDRPE